MGSFHSKKHLARACKILLATVGRGDLWRDDGPTNEAAMLRQNVAGDEQIMLDNAWGLWQKDGSRLDGMSLTLFMTITKFLGVSDGRAKEAGIGLVNALQATDDALYEWFAKWNNALGLGPMDHAN